MVRGDSAPPLASIGKGENLRQGEGREGIGETSVALCAVFSPGVWRSWANSVPRVRTVVRGERASRSIVNRTTALWSIWVVASLILSGLGFVVVYVKTQGREFAVSRGSNGVHDRAGRCPGDLNGLYH